MAAVSSSSSRNGAGHIRISTNWVGTRASGVFVLFFKGSVVKFVTGSIVFVGFLYFFFAIAKQWERSTAILPPSSSVIYALSLSIYIFRFNMWSLREKKYRLANKSLYVESFIKWKNRKILQFSLFIVVVGNYFLINWWRIWGEIRQLARSISERSGFFFFRCCPMFVNVLLLFSDHHFSRSRSTFWNILPHQWGVGHFA